jgi:hypothetical protein
VRGPSTVRAGGANRTAPPADIFQSPDPAALAMKNQDVAVFRAKLPQPTLLQGVERGGDQLPDP